METISEKYNMLLSIRDSLPITRVELQALEELDEVQRYKRLQEYYKKYQELGIKSDLDILRQAIEGDTSLNTEMYFCYGHNLPGASKKIGDYYIREDIGNSTYLPVSKYRSLKDESDIVILPFIEDKKFEKKHEITYAQTKDPEQEYQELRLKLYQMQIQEEQKRRL
ncbi:MAG: hypothetical protein IKQ29_03070 [Bacilli bacterium]|nr:hypothetical protein [Bacilli bacterium]